MEKIVELIVNIELVGGDSEAVSYECLKSCITVLSDKSCNVNNVWVSVLLDGLNRINQWYNRRIILLGGLVQLSKYGDVCPAMRIIIRYHLPFL